VQPLCKQYNISQVYSPFDFYKSINCSKILTLIVSLFISYININLEQKIVNLKNGFKKKNLEIYRSQTKYFYIINLESP